MTKTVDAIELATAAFEKGRESLAYQLLSRSPSKARGVPLLIEKKMWDEAISAAADSGDASLLIYTLNCAKENGANLVLKNCLKKSEIARNEWSYYVPEEDKLEASKDTSRYVLQQIKVALKEGKKMSMGS